MWETGVLLLLCCSCHCPGSSAPGKGQTPQPTHPPIAGWDPRNEPGLSRGHGGWTTPPKSQRLVLSPPAPACPRLSAERSMSLAGFEEPQGVCLLPTPGTARLGGEPAPVSPRCLSCHAGSSPACCRGAVCWLRRSAASRSLGLTTGGSRIPEVWPSCPGHSPALLRGCHSR